jgi:hypothetical protein
MAAISLQFDKVNFERKKPIEDKVSVSNNVRILNVEKIEVGKTKKRDGLKFSFQFDVLYEPGIAKMMWDGHATVLTSPEIVKEEMESWEKDKKVSNDLMSGVINSILTRTNIAALILAREVGLPPPVQLPKVNVK